jgi:hypothetical protein
MQAEVGFEAAEHGLDIPYKMPLIIRQDSTKPRDSGSRRYALWCAGLDHAMSEGSSYPVWETLPAERRHGLVLALGQMAMRQIRNSSTARQTVGEIAGDDGQGVHATAAGRPVGENFSAAP